MNPTCEIEAVRLASKVCPRTPLTQINDGSNGHRKVLALFDKALEK